MKKTVPKLLNKEKYLARGSRGRPLKSEYRDIPKKDFVQSKFEAKKTV